MRTAPTKERNFDRGKENIEGSKKIIGWANELEEVGEKWLILDGS